MKIAEELAKRVPRETSGSRTSGRYDFQKHWAICKLLDIYTSVAEFLVLLDYHEDIVILDHEKTPSTAEFYQIKTKGTGTWSLPALTKKGQDGSQSILEKLYSAHQNFGDSATKLHFVSNKEAKFKLLGQNKIESVKDCSFQQLDITGKESIHKCLEGESATFCDISGLNKLTTTTTLLSLDDHATHTKGKLVDFFESHWPGHAIPTSAVYKTLFDEFKRKTNDDNVYTEFSALAKSKGIAASDFRRMISSVASSPSAESIWSTASAYLIKEGTSPLSLTQIRIAFFEYAVSRMNPVDESLSQLSAMINRCIANRAATLAALNLSSMADTIYQDISTANISRKYKEHLIKAAIIYEALNETVQEADSKSKEKTI